MSLFQRSPSSSRRPRPAAPSCRGGASSMLRLAQPVSPRKGSLSHWLTRAATMFSANKGVQDLGVRPSEFAPSQWLVGH